MADEIIIETTSAEVIEVGVPGPQGPAGAPGTGLETLTTQGDTLYRGASTGQRLPIGTSGQVLKVSAQGIPAWANESGAVTSVNGATGAVTLTQNDIPEASQTFTVTSTNPASPTSVDVEDAFMEPDGTVDCSIVLNNTTGIVYANIILPQLLTGLRGRVVVHGTTSGSGDITYIRTEVGGSVAFPSSGYYEHPLAWRLVFEWNGQEWTVHPFFGTSPITFPPYSGTLAVFVPTPPATKTSNGQTGQIAYLNPHFYICVAPNTWRRATVAAW